MIARAANQSVTTFAMIETAEAMDNLEAIQAVDGIEVRLFPTKGQH